MNWIEFGSFHVLDLLFFGSLIVGTTATTTSVHNASGNLPLIRSSFGLRLGKYFECDARAFVLESGVKIVVGDPGEDVIVAFTLRTILAVDVIFFDSLVHIGADKDRLSFKLGFVARIQPLTAILLGKWVDGILGREFRADDSKCLVDFSRRERHGGMSCWSVF